MGPTHSVDTTQQRLEETEKNQTQASDMDICGPTVQEQKQEHDSYEAAALATPKTRYREGKARHRGNSQHKRSDNVKGTTRKRDSNRKTVWNP